MVGIELRAVSVGAIICVVDVCGQVWGLGNDVSKTLTGTSDSETMSANSVSSHLRYTTPCSRQVRISVHFNRTSSNNPKIDSDITVSELRGKVSNIGGSYRRSTCARFLKLCVHNRNSTDSCIALGAKVTMNANHAILRPSTSVLISALKTLMRCEYLI